MAPSSKAKAAGAPVKVDITDLKDGEKIDLIWRKKPIWVLKEIKVCLTALIQIKISTKTQCRITQSSSQTLQKIS